MKSLLRPILCGGILTALLCTPSLAAEPGDFTLLVNGEPVTFTDAAPVLKDGRSFLPMAATFEALGFPADQITWDGEARTVTAVKPDVTYTSFQGTEKQGDLTVKLAIGSNTFSVQYEGNTTAGPHGDQVQVVEDYTADAAPYIDAAASRTYIPVGLVADALGYRVGWDGTTSTVIIDDVEAILAENTETYELMDQYLDYARKYSQGNYQVEGSYLISMPSVSEGTYIETDGTSYPVTAEIVNTVGGSYNMVANQTAFQMDTTISLGGTLEGQPISPTDMDLDMRADLDTGMLYLYFQSEDLNWLLSNVEINGEKSDVQIPDQWYSLDMKAVYDEAYGPGVYEELIALNAASASEDMTFAQSLEDILDSDMLPLTSGLTTKDYLEAFNLLLGDSSFQKSGSTYTSTLEQDGATVRFTLYSSAGKINGYGMEMTAADAATGGEMTMTMELKGEDMTFLFEMSGMTMEMDGTYQAASAAPETEPPAGAKVVDLWELLTTPISEL